MGQSIVVGTDNTTENGAVFGAGDTTTNTVSVTGGTVFVSDCQYEPTTCSLHGWDAGQV